MTGHVLLVRLKLTSDGQYLKCSVRNEVGEGVALKELLPRPVDKLIINITKARPENNFFFIKKQPIPLLRNMSPSLKALN